MSDVSTTCAVVIFIVKLTVKMTLKRTTAQVVEMSVTVNNSPIQDYVHPDNHTQPSYEMTPVFKPFTIIVSSFALQNMPALEANHYCIFFTASVPAFCIFKTVVLCVCCKEVYCQVSQHEHSFQKDITFSLMS